MDLGHYVFGLSSVRACLRARPGGGIFRPACLISGVGTMRNYVPPSSGLVPPVPPSQRCGLCQNFKQTTLTTRLYKVRTNLYPPHLRKRSDAPMFDKDIATESYMMHYNCGKKICYTLIYALGIYAVSCTHDVSA